MPLSNRTGYSDQPSFRPHAARPPVKTGEPSTLTWRLVRRAHPGQRTPPPKARRWRSTLQIASAVAYARARVRREPLLLRRGRKRTCSRGHLEKSVPKNRSQRGIIRDFVPANGIHPPSMRQGLHSNDVCLHQPFFLPLLTASAQQRNCQQQGTCTDKQHTSDPVHIFSPPRQNP